MKEKGYDDGYNAGYEHGRFNGSLWTVIIILIGAAILIVVGSWIIEVDSAETKIIDSKIIDIIYLSDESFYTIYFEDGQHYNINKDVTHSDYEVVTDFDDSQRVIVELRYTSGFLFPNVDNCWCLVKVIKY